VILLAVTGLAREAKIIGREGVRVVVSGADASQLASRLERAIATGARGVISVGIAGALDPALRSGDCVLATGVTDGVSRHLVDSRWLDAMARALVPAARTGLIAGSDLLISDNSEKFRLRARTGALTVDMESHFAVRAARDHKIPFAALRIVADTATSSLPAAARLAVASDGGIRIAAVMRSVLAQPAQIARLISAARASKIAFDELFRCLDLLGTGLACPYLG
jgi:hopanoid-associated phosphorylase